jgi:2-polyprenyl-3-methyl-5-hydroxy-6-metoxy-1,4-benzoquinol methylase
MGYEVRTHAVGGEGINFRRATFDTVVSINVLEHCQNAFEYMRKIHQVLKPGGQLIFHDRVYDGFWSVIDPVKDGPVEIAGLHPLRVKMRLIDIFMQGRYTASLFSRKLTREMEDRSKTQIKEDPVWIIAKKNHNATAQSSIQQGS